MNSRFVVVKPPQHRLDEGEEILRARDLVFHVGCCFGARQKDFPDDLEARLEVDARAHDDVIDVRLGSIPASGREEFLRRHM